MACLLSPRAALPERLPIRLYTTEHGLVGDQISAVLQDARGFVWVATATGLSRFNGARFTNYDERDGLPPGLVSSLAETADGSLWAATYGGVARLKQRREPGSAAFEAIPLDLGSGGFRPLLLAEPAGGLWLSGPRGLYRASDFARPEFGRVDLGAGLESVQIGLLALGPDGSLWMAGTHGLLRRFADGRVLRYAAAEIERAGIHALLCDRTGRLWIGSTLGLFVMRAEPPPNATPDGQPLADGAHGKLVELERFSRANGLPSDYVTNLAEADDGAVWVTAAGLVRFVDGRPVQTVGRQQGLAELALTAVYEDRDRNLWLGSESRGLMRLVAGGFISYGEADGLVNDRIASVFSDPQGALWVITSAARLYRFAAGGFEPATPPAWVQERAPSWGSHQLAARDRQGEWWLPSSQGVLRYAGGAELAHAQPKAIYGKDSGLPANDIFRVWADAAGDLWVSIIGPQPLIHWRRRDERFQSVPEVTARANVQGAPTAYAEDRAGNLWVGFFGGGLARRRGESWTFYGAGQGVPGGLIWDLYCDRRGRLWIASSRDGVGRLDHPESETPRIEPVGGLSAGGVDCITEDGEGRLYFGTRRGVERLDADTGSVRRFSTQDGLPSSRVHVCHRDRGGRLWFGTLHGLASLDPALVPAAAPHPVWLSAVRAGGVPQAVAEGEATRLDGLVLGPQASSLRVEFVALGHALGEELRYQHQLEGADGGWSEPSVDRAVEYPRLAAGTYRLLVRAVGAENTVGAPAAVSFRVLPSVWRRGWFQLLAVLLLTAAVWTWHRARMARVVAVERVRTRISADLHDDVGASLSQIALLADLGRMSDAPGALAQIGEDARTLIDATSDIVWAIDPRRDDLRSLLVRLRRFAADLLEARGIRLDFAVPDHAERIELEPELRRELYLLLKEAVHNVAKHAQARRARVHLEVVAGALRIEVADDGVGFVPGAEDGGKGLHSMAERAARLGGKLHLDAAPGAGTRLRLEVPR